MRIVTLLPFFLWIGLANADAPANSPVFTNGDEVRLDPDKPLWIITHSSSSWDTRATTYMAVNEDVDAAKSLGHSLVYLMSNDSPSNYFFKDWVPTYFVSSHGGELGFSFDATTVFSSGGYFEQCQQHTVLDVLKNWSDSRFSGKVLTLYLNSQSIFQHGGLLDKTAPFFSRYQTYSDILGTKTFPLSQLLRLMGDSQLIAEYLARYVDEVLEMLPSSASQREIIVTLGKGRAEENPELFRRTIRGSGQVDAQPIYFSVLGRLPVSR